jgi:hypothetical protein
MATRTEVGPNTVMIDQQQQQRLVYASLMRFGNETISLRHRAIDQMVLNALAGTNPTNPKKIGEVQQTVSIGGGISNFRPEVLRESVTRLEQQGKVSHLEIKKKQAYFLTDLGKSLSASAFNFAKDLYKPVIDRLLQHTAHLCSQANGIKICTSFICEAFERCGIGIAKDLGGYGGLPHSSELAAAFAAAVNGHDLSAEARKTLEIRCLNLFKSREPEDVRFIFYLTQGYYFAQLVGLDQQGFDPVADQAFAGSIFYLDTNVLVLGLLPGASASAFEELLKVAKRIGVDLRVTRATINEARRVAADRQRELMRVMDIVPEEIAAKSLDDFVVLFYEQRRSNPTLTPDEYLGKFEKISDVVAQWGIEIEEITEDEVLKGRTFPQWECRVQELAAKYRKGRTKHQGVLRHDMAHYALIQDCRILTAKTWFLTRDRTLTTAAEDLCGDGPPFCFSLLGFLQSISPYVTSDEEVLSFSAVFSTLLNEQVLITSDRLFDSKELVLLAEMHSDVLSTPSDSLITALDFVKHTVLNGKAYRSEDMPLVSLELRKFLASSKDEQKRALASMNATLQAELEQEKGSASVNRSERLKAEKDLSQKAAELCAKDQELQGALKALQLAQKNSEDLRTRIENLGDVNGRMMELSDRLEAQSQRNRLLLGVGGMALGALLWGMRHLIFILISSKTGWQHGLQPAIASAAAAVFCIPFLYFLRRSNWRPEIAIASGTALLVAGAWGSGIMSADTASALSSYTTLGACFAAFLVFKHWRS